MLASSDKNQIPICSLTISFHSFSTSSIPLYSFAFTLSQFTITGQVRVSHIHHNRKVSRPDNAPLMLGVKAIIITHVSINPPQSAFLAANSYHSSAHYSKNSHYDYSSFTHISPLLLLAGWQCYLAFSLAPLTESQEAFVFHSCIIWTSDHAQIMLLS